MSPSGSSSGYIEVYKDRSDDWRWRRVAANGHVLADGGEGYARRIDMLEVVAKDYPLLEVVDVSPQRDDDYEPPEPVEPQET